jgi:tRNA A-37 threonylcarbamoyl transferase component Bud32
MKKNNNLKYGYTNQTTRVGNVAEKLYSGPGAANRWAAEVTLLSFLQGKLPVPRLVNANIHGGIQTTWVNGLHAQDLLREEQGEMVMAVLGDLLKQVQQIPVDELAGKIPGDGTCLVHGDFGPQNLILSQKSRQPAALLDWEWAHLGSPVEDLAWVEWIMRMHHQNQLKFITVFFDHYGELPVWSLRQEAMILQCKRHLEFAHLEGKRKNIQIWQNRMVMTRRFKRL